ncbi:wax ester/triacylglycerol synthase family O-acyltransferase [Zhongshania sp.]|uniref:wax ester/triacylglycerol synthase family O-acyltransferase n=1 Tax=Zhongshania sp. TaxID=1971902 RepID=UPI00356524F8
MAHLLNPSEHSWLLLGSKTTPMHLGALLIFKLPAKAAKGHVAGLIAQLRAPADIVAPWNYTLVKGLRPAWSESSEVDLDYHVRHTALPEPGGERELGGLVSRLHSHPLDMRRPLWECHLIEGLSDGRYALFFKMHHSLTDSSGFYRLLTDWLASVKSGKVSAAPWTTLSQRSTADAKWARPILASVNSPKSAWQSAVAMSGAFGRLLRAGSGASAALKRPYQAPRSPLNVPIGPSRRLATQKYSQARLTQLAQASSSSVECIILYLCATALRRFFKEYNALPDAPLIAAIPSQRQGDSSAASLNLVSLASHIADPLKRLAAINQSYSASKSHLEGLSEGLKTVYTGITALPYVVGQLSGASALVPAMFNINISSETGPAERQYCNGAELVEFYPMFPLAQDSALSITCLHYADNIHIGICGARETLPSLQRLAVYMEQALDDLGAMLEEGAVQ